MRRWGGLALGSVLLALALLIVPSLLRRETVRFRWAGEIGASELREPIGIALVGGRLYVTDAARARVVVFDTSGALIRGWRGDELGLARPMHLEAGPEDLLYIADYLGDRIVVVDTAGHRVRTVGGSSGGGPGELDAPGGVAVLGSSLLVADFYNHRIQGFGPNGAFTVGRPGRLFPGRLHYPTDVATADSLLYVADAYNHRIQVFRPDGRRVRGWGGPLGLGIPGPFKGWFRVATGGAPGGGRGDVAGVYNVRVPVFRPRGRYLGQTADSLTRPTDVAVGADGTLYVADFGRGRVARFQPQAGRISTRASR
ncbi:MAG: 6-bladed beta-propeller [Gemmatimonadota bacterium]